MKEQENIFSILETLLNKTIYNMPSKKKKNYIISDKMIGL